MLRIGIDTGVNTGFAVVRGDEVLQVKTLRIHQAMAEILALQEQGEELQVFFEDARKRKWIPREGSYKEQLGRRQGAGSVKRDASIWEDFLKDNNIPYTAIAPRPGATKWNETQFQTVTKYTKKTSEHGRDAAILALTHQL